jgi:hypothetical protein
MARRAGSVTPVAIASARAGRSRASVISPGVAEPVDTGVRRRRGIAYREGRAEARQETRWSVSYRCDTFGIISAVPVPHDAARGLTDS